MSFFGDLLGYDHNGLDFLGTHRDAEQNCPVCGMAAITHSREKEAQCLSKMFRKTDTAGRDTP